jgi:alkylation response protein AidB-like acyl-CoA dehydrogenase
VQFGFTSEQQEFRSVLRRFFEETSPPGVVRRMMETEVGWERETWRELNNQLGLCGVRVPEAYGGQGFGFVEQGIVLEEMGRALLCAPYFASAVLATTAILNAASEAQKTALLPPIVAGEVIATLAFTEPNGRWDAAGTETTATPADGGAFRLDGVKSFVLDGAAADLIVVTARRPGSIGEDGLSLFTVRGDAPGLERRALKVMDPTRRQARLEFRGVEAQLLGEDGGAAGPLAKTLAQAAACLASEMVGGAERLRESALDYANLRVQFGRPIASFQSMKHKQADMLLEVELAKSAAYAAAEAADDDEDMPALASLAKASASEAYLQTAMHTIQIHGGIGFTWDNDTHLWFKRAKSSEVFLGDPAWHREQMLRAWGV